MGEAFKTACARIEVRPSGPLLADRGSNLLPTPPRWSIPPRLREGVAAEWMAPARPDLRSLR
jgi:hypothetical protein